tara:strand:- start:1050 stop:1172 length:123 start_codon:yes stop_codon:yes gene_type:complete
MALIAFEVRFASLQLHWRSLPGNMRDAIRIMYIAVLSASR